MLAFELVTPIPPIITGTATYFDLLLENLLTDKQLADRITVVTDAQAWCRDGLEGQIPDRLRGVPVQDWQEVSSSPSRDTVRIYFLANNDKHVFVHRMLAQQDADCAAYVISVLHDPSMFMVHEHMMRSSVPEFSMPACAETMRSQLGGVASPLLGAYFNNWLPEAFAFGVHCMGTALSKSDELWTHSVYGANRVLYENSFEKARCRTIKVCAHPREKSAQDLKIDEQTGSSGDDFNIGVFGWVTPPKRVGSVLRGVSHAMDRLTDAERARIRLRIVGKRPKIPDYDVVALAEQLGLGQYIDFIDYPPRDEFEKLIRESDLVFNLRYPSCGETSGTLVSAQTHNIKVVASRYQAFREAVGIWRYINVVEPYEVWDIADAIVDALRGSDFSVQSSAPVVMPIENLISRMIKIES